MKPVVCELRKRDLQSIVYLDDWLHSGDNLEKCHRNVEATKSLLKSLGFLINKRKSMLKPSTRCKYLGFMLDSTRRTMELPQEKKERILMLVTEFERLQWCKIREFAQFVSTLTAACPAVAYGWIYQKLFERQKYLALLLNRDDFDSVMYLPEELKGDFDWWKRNILESNNPIRLNSY